MNYREKIREAIKCPRLGNSSYGEWGALRYEQRVLIKRLLDELDDADNLILINTIKLLYCAKKLFIAYHSFLF